MVIGVILPFFRYVVIYFLVLLQNWWSFGQARPKECSLCMKSQPRHTFPTSISALTVRYILCSFHHISVRLIHSHVVFIVVLQLILHTLGCLSKTVKLTLNSNILSVNVCREAVTRM